VATLCQNSSVLVRLRAVDGTGSRDPTINRCFALVANLPGPGVIMIECSVRTSRRRYHWIRANRVELCHMKQILPRRQTCISLICPLIHARMQIPSLSDRSLSFSTILNSSSCLGWRLLLDVVESFLKHETNCQSIRLLRRKTLPFHKEKEERRYQSRAVARNSG